MRERTRQRLLRDLGYKKSWSNSQYKAEDYLLVYVPVAVQPFNHGDWCSDWWNAAKLGATNLRVEEDENTGQKRCVVDWPQRYWEGRWGQAQEQKG